jgi:hypothetical protein
LFFKPVKKKYEKNEQPGAHSPDSGIDAETQAVAFIEHCAMSLAGLKGLIKAPATLAEF